MASMSVLSRKFVLVPVTELELGIVVNPTANTVEMAFPLADADPVAGDWKAADWETAGTTYYARCLVGTGGTVALPVGAFDCWVKILDPPEIAVERAGRLVIR